MELGPTKVSPLEAEVGVACVRVLTYRPYSRTHPYSVCVALYYSTVYCIVTVCVMTLSGSLPDIPYVVVDLKVGYK